jgi:hypothetical protein
MEVSVLSIYTQLFPLIVAIEAFRVAQGIKRRPFAAASIDFFSQ